MNPTVLSDARLAVVTPMANEEETAVPFVFEVLKETVLFKEVIYFLVFDNACTDDSRALVATLAQEDPRVRVIWAPENKSVVDAYLRGYQEALASGFEWILEIDAGYSHQPSDFRGFLPSIEEGYECIFGSRFMEGGSVTNMPWQRQLLSRGGTFLTNLLLGTSLSDMTSGFQAFQHSALEVILDKGIKARGHFFQTEMKVHARDFEIIEVPIHYASPSNSISTSSINDAFSHLFRLFAGRLSNRA